MEDSTIKKTFSSVGKVEDHYLNLDYLTICLDEDYISDKEFQTYREDCIKVIQLVNGYIRFLQKEKHKGNNR